MRIRIHSRLRVACIVAFICVVGIMFFYRSILSIDRMKGRDTLEAWILPEADVLLHARYGMDGRKMKVVSPLMKQMNEGLRKSGLTGTEMLFVRCSDAKDWQLVLCSLSASESILLEQWLCVDRDYFPEIKTVRYLDDEIRICPLSDGTFLSCCQLANGVWVASFQKKMVEHTLDYFRNRTLGGESLIPLSLGEDSLTLWIRSVPLSRLYRGTGVKPDSEYWKYFSCSVSSSGLCIEGKDELDPVQMGWVHLTDSLEHFLINPQVRNGVVLPDSLSFFEFSPYIFVEDLEMDVSGLSDADQKNLSSFENFLREAGAFRQYRCCFDSIESAFSDCMVGFQISDPVQAEVSLRKWLWQHAGISQAEAFFYEKNKAYALYRLPFPLMCFGNPTNVSGKNCWITIADGCVWISLTRSGLMTLLAERRRVLQIEDRQSMTDKNVFLTRVVWDSVSCNNEMCIPDCPFEVLREDADGFTVSFEYINFWDRQCGILKSYWSWKW